MEYLPWLASTPVTASIPDLSHEIELSPAFHDLDPMNIVWHGNYVKYLELARNALMAKFNYDYPQMHESGYAWPIVDLRVKYVGSVRYGQARAHTRAHRRVGEPAQDRVPDPVRRNQRAGFNKASTVQVALDIKTRLKCAGSARRCCGSAWA